MSESIVLFYGTPGASTLEVLYQHVRERGRRRAVFVVQEKFPRELGLQVGAGRNDPSGFLYPPKEEPVPLDSVCGVCLDGYFIADRSLDDVEPGDIDYAKTESWATLIALFHRLSQQCVVANHITRRDALRSRSARLAFLATCGLRVPPTLVTSNPAAARAFYDKFGPRTFYQSVTLQIPQLKQMQPDDVHRLEALRLAPSHFEADPPGRPAHYVKVGSNLMQASGGPVSPDVLERCQHAANVLDLHFAEFTLREVDGRWIVVDLHPHLTPYALSVPEVLEAAISLLEGPDL